MRLRSIIPASLTLVTALGLAACSPAYSSLYKETNHSLSTQPVPPKDVKVVKSRNDLTRSFTELGVYKGKAPTVEEAMEMAQENCGREGADLYILNTEPFASEGGFKVDGICAVSG